MSTEDMLKKLLKGQESIGNKIDNHDRRLIKLEDNFASFQDNFIPPGSLPSKPDTINDEKAIATRSGKIFAPAPQKTI